MKQLIHVIAFSSALLIAGPTSATTVTYIMDRSNVLQNEEDYLSVSLSDDVAGQLDFIVYALSPLEEIAGGNFGIQSFAFNLPGIDEVDPDNFLLPGGWKVQTDKGMSAAGKFDIRLLGTGNSRQDPLEFSIIGLELDHIGEFFAAHVAGFEGLNGPCNGEPEYEERYSQGYEELGCKGVTSAFFYGDRLVEEPNPIPLPASFWLLGSGLVALSATARRRRRAAGH